MRTKEREHLSPKSANDSATASLDSARAALAAQPFSRLLGAEVVSFALDGVELRLPITKQLTQQNGFVHGGVVSYAADNALTFAGGSALGAAVVTSEFKLNYLRPATGDVLIAKARVVYAGKNQAVCQCEVSALANGVLKLCALAQGTVTHLGQSKVNQP